MYHYGLNVLFEGRDVFIWEFVVITGTLQKKPEEIEDTFRSEKFASAFESIIQLVQQESYSESHLVKFPACFPGRLPFKQVWLKIY